MHQTRGVSMLIRVLGSIEASNGDPIALGGAIQRRLLAALALDAGEVVSLDRLVDISWPAGEAPEHAERNVRTYVHRLRAAFGPDLAGRIETVEPGYRLNLERGELDADRFDELASSAARLASAGDADGALELIDAARSLWHGRVFGEFADEAWAAAEVERLSDVHIGLRELKAELLTEVGRPAEAIRVLEDLIAELPLREHPRVLHMRALCGAGRQVDALRAFQDFRSLLIDEVGVEPSVELVELDRAIASGETDHLRPAPATRRVGAYELLEQIGEGAFAVVYRGVQTGLDRPVAIKAIRAELANRPEFIRRFEAEAHMVARLEHPHIVPLYDYWREPDRAYLVMRWLTGGTLEQSLDHGPWSVEQTARMVDQIGSALAVAHRAGVVHRDVKPANIVLDDEGNTFLTDFGIALEAEDRSHPEAALSHGSPAYASPEQLRKEPAGPPADIHGLAIAVYEALTNELPFGDSADPATALRRQLGEPIPRVSARRPEVPAAVDEVLQRAAAKDPRSRYQDVLEFAEAFVGAAAGIGIAPAGRAPTLTVLAGDIENPYKGLRAFDESDADDFFGRERLVDELLGRLDGDDSGSRLLTLVGPSGSGKSSVVQAGLLPALRRGAVPGSDEWFVTTMHPGAHPFEQLESALLRVAVNPPASLLDQLSSGPRGILRGVQRALPDDRTRLLVVIDQFEELFTLCADAEACTRFLAGLVAAASEPATPVRFVLTLRADFYDRPLRHPDFATLIKQNSVTVTPLAGDELEHAIVDPAARVGVEFETGLVAEIVAEVAGQPGALPLLQYALTELFEAQVSRLLLLEHYRDLGGLSGALARRADELYQSSSPEDRSAIRALFGRLITPGEGTGDTRRRVRLSEAMIDEATERVVDTYGSARLLTFDHDPVTREPTVEVAHEALIREWPRLRDWLDDDRQGLRIHRHLTTSAAAWAERGRDTGELYRGVRLDAAADWADTTGPALNPVEAEFLATSVAQRDTEEAAEKARVRRLRRLLVITGIVAIVALVAGVIAFREQQRADDQAALALANAQEAEANAALATENEAEALASEGVAEQRAEEAEEARAEAEEAEAQADLERLKAVALNIAGDSPTVAALLAVEAHDLDPSVNSLNVLHSVLTAVPGLRRAIDAGPYLDSRLLDDGVTLAVAGPDAIDVWDLRLSDRLLSIPHDSQLATALLDATPDGRRAAARTAGDETAIHDLITGDTLGSVSHGALVRDLDVSSDGGRLAAALSDGTVEIWDLEALELERTLDTGDVEVRFARWNPVADRIAIVTLASETQYWNPATGERLWTAAAPESDIGIVNENTPFAFLFGSDGERFVFVSGSLKGEIRVHETSGGDQPLPPVPVTNVRGFVLDAMYWIDEGAMVIGLSSQGNVTEVDLTDGSQPATELAHLVTGASDVVYSPVLDRLVVVGPTGLEYLSTDRSGPLEVVAPLSVEQRAAVADRGNLLTSLAGDGSNLLVSVFPVLPGQVPRTSFDLTTDPPTRKDLSPDGGITLGFGPFTLFGDVVSGLQILRSDGIPLGPPVLVPPDFTEVGVSPDGRWFALGRLGGHADLYTGTGEFVQTLSIGGQAQYEGAQTAPWFTSDGEYMVVGTTEGAFGLWSTKPLERIEVPNADQWSGGTLMGSWLFVDRGDGAFLRLDLPTFEPVGEPFLADRLGYVSFDETHLRVATTADEFVRVYDLDSGQQLGTDLPYGGGAARPEFSGDGELLGVPNVDRVTVWNFDTDTWADIACELAGRNLTQDEWDQLGPRTIERRATCPQYPL